jgi:proteasome lid subunit RPN8/RPN11
VSSTVRIEQSVLAQITEQARRGPAGEICGLLAGLHGVIRQAFPAHNVAVNPAKNYEIAPQEIIGLMRRFRASGIEFLGIYHSHPMGENKPSARDLERAYYSEEVYFIISPQADAPKPVRAFSIRDGRAAELDIEIV